MELNDSRKKGWSLVGCFCFCALWSSALLLSADGETTSGAGADSADPSGGLNTSKLEREPSKQVDEAAKAEKSEAGAAVRAGAGDSQRGQKDDRSTTAAAAAANLTDGKPLTQGTRGDEQENPEGSPEVPAAAAAAAAGSQGEKIAQDTKKEKESHGPTPSTESTIKEGQSKQTQDSVGPWESKATAGTAAGAKDSDQDQKGWKDGEGKAPTSAAALRESTTSKGTSEGGSTGSTGSAVSAGAVENLAGEPDVTNQCTLTDAHTVFWRSRVKSSSVSSPALTSNAEDSAEGIGLYSPVNPFFDALLSCGRNARAQKDLTETCVQARLEQLQREPLSKSCLACFTESIHCGAENCRSSCFLDSCAEKCLQCTSEHCRSALEKCVGLGQLPPVCVPEEATTSQEEDEEKGDSSQQQKAWSHFLHRFAETEEESH